MRQLEAISGPLIVASGIVFLLGSFGPLQSTLAPYKKWAEYGVIAGAGLWVVGRVA